MSQPPSPRPDDALWVRIHAVLPQTQCRRCGHADCAAYAQAIADGQTAINRCPPGGASGVAQIAAALQRPELASLPLDITCGAPGPQEVALIDEDWCIGCTLCIKACPTDAITGSHKHMHTVMAPYCTGCALCLPVCPVDCIAMQPAASALWTQAQATQALQRYKQRQQRLQRTHAQRQASHLAEAQLKYDNLAAYSQHTDAAVLEKKRAYIAAAIERARAQTGRTDKQTPP